MNSADSQVVSSAGPNATSRTDASSDTPAAQRDGNRKQCLSLNVTDIIRTEALPFFRQLAGRGDAMKKLPGTPGCFRTAPCRRWAAAAPSGAPGRGWRAGVAAGAPLGAAPPEQPRVQRGVAVEAAARLAERGAASATRPRQGRRRPSPPPGPREPEPARSTAGQGGGFWDDGLLGGAFRVGAFSGGTHSSDY